VTREPGAPHIARPVAVHSAPQQSGWRFLYFL